MDNFDHGAAGMLFGIRHGSSRNEEKFAIDKAKLLRELKEAYETEMVERAKKDAIKLCIKAAVNELTSTAAGVRINKRHSDPKQRSAHVEDYIDTAGSVLTRISDGHLGFTKESEAALKVKSLGISDAAAGLGRKQEVVRMTPRNGRR